MERNLLEAVFRLLNVPFTVTRHIDVIYLSAGRGAMGEAGISFLFKNDKEGNEVYVGCQTFEGSEEFHARD